MKTQFVLLLLLAIATGFASPKRVRVLLWSEQTEPREIYPTGISGALAEYLSKDSGMEPKTAQLSDPDSGVSDAALDNTDVLIWFGHRKHQDVPDEVVERVVRHVKEKGMGFIALHSSHFSKPLKKLLNAPGSWSSYVNQGKTEQMWVVLPKHPIAKGLTDFTIPKDEIYTEPFDVPAPEAVILEGTWESGHRNREVMVWNLGKGRLVYVRAGHEEYPIYHQPEMQRLISNSVLWAAGRTNAGHDLARREAGPPATAQGPLRVTRSAGTAQPLVVVLNKYDDTVDLFDPRANEKVGTIPTGSHPHEVALSPGGNFAYVTIYGTGVYGNNPIPNHKIAVINLKSRNLEKEIDVSPYESPHGIAVDPKGNLWVTCENNKSVLVIDPESGKITNTIQTSTSGTHWIAITPDGTKAYTSNKETPHISVISLDSKKVVKTIPVPNGVEGIGLSPDGKRLYAGDFQKPLLFAIDASTDEMVKQIDLKNRPGRVRVTNDNRLILITNYRPDTSASVEVVDVAGLTSQKLIPVGRAPMGVTFGGNGRFAFIANSGETSVSVIDLQKLEVVRTHSTGKGPDGIAFAIVN